MTIPKFVSVSFYPAYEVGDIFACGRYVALGEDGRVYVLLMKDGGARWLLLGEPSYAD